MKFPLPAFLLLGLWLFGGLSLKDVQGAETPAASKASPSPARSTPPTEATTAKPADPKARQRTLQGKLSLTDAVNLAMRQNPDVLRAIREVERSHGYYVEVRAQALPRLGVVSGLNHVEEKLASGGGPVTGLQTTSWNITFQLRQALYAGGAISANIKAAKLSQNAAYYTLRDTLDRIVAEVRKQFTQVLLAEALIEVAEESVELAQKQLEDAKNRFDAGTVPRFNVLRTEVELASLRPTLIRAKNEFLIARLQLSKLLGLEASPSGKPEFQCVGELLVEERSFNLADSIKLSRARRPSLKSQREQILVEKERIQVALSGFKPKINAQLNYETRNRFSDPSFENRISGYFLGLTGSWDIFSGFETVGQVSQARARMESAMVSYEDSMQQVELEVQKAFADLQQHRETIESQAKNVQQALEALRLAQERLSAGAGTQLEVLDARVALTRARNTELQARGDYVRTLADFDRVTALSTQYEDSFKDPLAILEKSLLKQAPVSLFKP